MGRLHFGVHKSLEDEANSLIRESLKGVTSMSAKSDILTPWKEQDRRNREVYSEAGVPDSAVRKGMYVRAWNPKQTHLNSRDGVVRARRDIGSSLQNHVSDYTPDSDQ